MRPTKNFAPIVETTAGTASNLVSAEHSLTLTEGLHAPSRARAWISARLGSLPRPVTDDILLIASELVTNAVQHGEPDIVLRLQIDAQNVRIEVSDGNAELPSVSRAEPEIDRPTGRGLLIVAATASDWGVQRNADSAGKCVWAEVQLDGS
jgi:anti-sigma regulatory factor (Ser/Thr protein kinase)